MKKYFREVFDLPLQGKLLFGLFLLSSISLFFYSFTQIDLSLTLTPSIYPLAFQQFFKHIGYFQRPLSTALYIFILVLCTTTYLWVFLKKKLFDQKQFWFLLFIISTMLVLSYNSFSYDLFNYIFDAKIVTHYHQNPYLHAAQDFTGDPMLGFMRWVHRVYPYGPLWLGLTIPLSYLGLQNFFITQLLFKLLMAACFLISVWFLGKTQYEINPKFSLLSMLFFAFNPMVLIESLVSSHNDIVMVCFAVISVYFLVKKKNLLAYFFLLISIGIKFATIFLVPAYLYVNYLQQKKKHVDWVQILLFSILLMAAAVVAVTLRTNFQPWYLLYVLPFAALLSYKPYITIPTITISVLSLLQYVPYLFLGNWDPPVPRILMQLMLSSVIIASILSFGWYFRVRK